MMIAGFTHTRAQVPHLPNHLAPFHTIPTVRVVLSTDQTLSNSIEFNQVSSYVLQRTIPWPDTPSSAETANLISLVTIRKAKGLSTHNPSAAKLQSICKVQCYGATS